jgi:quercetin dioxygenase-like cupin family protein
MNKIFKSKLGETFIVTNDPSVDKFIEIDVRLEPNKYHRPLHYHPHQSEYFKIIEGQVKLQAGKEVKTLFPGDELTIPPNTNHCYWNDSNEVCVMKTRLTPALNFQEFLDNIIYLEHKTKTDKEGIPKNKFLAALFMTKFKNIMRPTNIPKPVIDYIFPVLAGIARLSGSKLHDVKGEHAI